MSINLPTWLPLLTEQLGADSVSWSDDDRLHYGRDWTKFFTPNPTAIVFPKTTEQVVQIVQFANEHSIAIVPSGGRTGLSGGAVATNGELVLVLDRMNKILDFDAIDQTVRCQAGVVTKQLQQFAEEKQLMYPVDFASSGSSQLGGNIATNAGGIKVIRYGLTRRWVAGLSVVTGKGELLHFNQGLVKNATGYDLRHLFIGSEGTLGIIVEATMQLCRPPNHHSVLLLGLPDMAAVMQVFSLFRDQFDLSAFEFFSDKALQHVMDRSGRPAPLTERTPFYVLLELVDLSASQQEQLLNCFEKAVEEGWVLDGVISQSDQQAADLWVYREHISESIAPRTPYKNDISVRVSKVSAFLAEVDRLVNRHYPDFEIIWFGHIGDGNLHLNILKPENLIAEEFFKQCNQVTKWVGDLITQFEGSISAEHGVGLLKKPYLHVSRSEIEIEYMRSMKKIFDPKCIMNPGKVFDIP